MNQGKWTRVSSTLNLPWFRTNKTSFFFFGSSRCKRIDAQEIALIVFYMNIFMNPKPGERTHDWFQSIPIGKSIWAIFSNTVSFNLAPSAKFWSPMLFVLEQEGIKIWLLSRPGRIQSKKACEDRINKQQQHNLSSIFMPMNVATSRTTWNT